MASAYPDLPRVAVGVLVEREGSVLLVRRGNAPSEGLWAVPGGSVELGESLRDAAEREVVEETGVVVKAGETIWAFDRVVHDDAGRVLYHYVVVDLLADYVSGEPVAGTDATEACWMPVGELARPEVSDLTRRLVAAQQFKVT